MNKLVIALGVVLIIASVVAITYTTTVVNPQGPCGTPCYPALQVPTTVNPYTSEGALFAVVGGLLMGVGFFIPTRTNQTGTTSPTSNLRERTR